MDSLQNARRAVLRTGPYHSVNNVRRSSSLVNLQLLSKIQLIVFQCLCKLQAQDSYGVYDNVYDYIKDSCSLYETDHETDHETIDTQTTNKTFAIPISLFYAQVKQKGPGTLAVKSGSVSTGQPDL